ncbi:MAG: cation diffusion facilitator family transporter [Nanoarchaeota archaeon]
MNKDQVSIAGLIENTLLFIFKLVVGLLTRSTSILAEALHSGTDVISSGITYVGIRISRKPVDKQHPYGHYKYEVLFGFFISLFIFGAGAYIIYEAIMNLFNPGQVEVNALALGVMAFSAIVNAGMAYWKIKVGKKENSLALVADGAHDKIDVFTSLSVLVGLVLTKWVWIYADSVVAILVGLYILKESIGLGKEATDNLLDVSAGEEKENKIQKVAKDMGLELTELKTQKRGSVFTANLTVSLPKNFDVEKATKTTEDFRQKLFNNIPELSYATISIEGSDTQTSYYKPPGFGRGYRWRAKTEPNIENIYCTCERCGYKEKKQRGVPCRQRKCPKCGIELKRSDADAETKKMQKNSK